MNKIKKNIKWIILISSIILFLIVLYYAYKIELMHIDKFFHKYLVECRGNDIITSIMKFITWLVDPAGLIIITIVFLFILNNQKNNIRLLLNLGFVLGINQLLKFLIRRERPIGYGLLEETGYSFPSGHTMVSLAFNGYLIYLIWGSKKSIKVKWTVTIFLSILTLMVGISRIYLGVHYASDVIAGICLSLGYLIIYTSILDKIDSKKGE